MHELILTVNLLVLVANLVAIWQRERQISAKREMDHSPTWTHSREVVTRGFDQEDEGPFPPQRYGYRK